MRSIAFIDTEIHPKSKTILDIGGIKDNGASFHANSIAGFTQFLMGSEFVCGHNIFNHDLKYVHTAVADAGIPSQNSIDTLYLSPLLFPARPYHALLKDDKLQTDDVNNPLNDSTKAKDLFFDEIAAFQQTDETRKAIMYLLLHDQKEFSAFFDYLGYQSTESSLESIIKEKFHGEICERAYLNNYILENPIELAYCLALIYCRNRYSITPPWVLKHYPEVERIIFALRNKPCLSGCEYCNQALDIHKGLKNFFGFDSFKTYAGEPLQEIAVKAAVDNKSILAVFPTGGGKSITFQIPALMSGVATKGLTVVISPLQSLMKDQVDNLERHGITDAVTINGLLDPIERAKSYERVEDGSASILYISPESLRSRTIERLLLGRRITRFVIDEAHCFSAWGQDFRVDYLYIGDFIKALQEKKNLQDPIPVSCFTATAKRNVIVDICKYFKDKLSLELEVFSSNASRTNLQYKVIEKDNDEEKYSTIRNLIEARHCPTIIYVSRVKKAEKIAKRLTDEGYEARPYHGKMDVKEKSANQDAFIAGEIKIMVATSAFGMGVDKKDVGLVIHYDISDSLENYIQEAGRAGRQEDITAECIILFKEEDLDKHFILLNQTKISIKEIQQIWKAIKDITKFRSTVSNSALEIARRAGWDDSVKEIETRVTTAVAALEDAGYLKRGQNTARVFADSILVKNMQQARERIDASSKFSEAQKKNAILIIQSLISSKSRKYASDEGGESRIDYISDRLGIEREDVIDAVNHLREEHILADRKDLTAFISNEHGINHSLNIVETFSRIENFLLPHMDETEKKFNVKELNEKAELDGCKGVSPRKIKTVFTFWAIKKWIKWQTDQDHVVLRCEQPNSVLMEKFEKRHELAKFIVEYLYSSSQSQVADSEGKKPQGLVEFSVHELKEAFDKKLKLFKMQVSIADVEDTLFYLSRIDALHIEGGFLVVYNRLTIDRLEQDNKRRYKAEDYEKLNQYYENKIQQIHIVGEYAKKMAESYKGALQFVDDYFRLNYSSFLTKYFPGSKLNDIKRNITPSKFRQLFGALSPKQLEIINDNQAKYIAVTAGPGSGKTRVLVHKLASLLLMEDVKHEQLLMLTFSRAAASDFKKKLLGLIGNAANYIEIKTFHSYCFDLLGRIGSLGKSDVIIKETIERIKNGDVESNRITKVVLVVDEAQDIDADEYALLNALMVQNEEMRVIAVGDDDQNIYAFRGASSKYLEQFIKERSAVTHELVENYRSVQNLVEFANGFVRKIHHRLKTTPIVAMQSDDGKIRLIRHHSDNLVVPLIDDVLKTELAGTTCILTKTNQEALQITGALLRKNIPAKLIQSNDGFNLFNLMEVRFFFDSLNLKEGTSVINEEMWDNAKRLLNENLHNSSKLHICTNIIKEFEVTNPKTKYRTDLEVFIRESKLEDFFQDGDETVFVSTIHKAKGREFDNVFLLLDRYTANTDDEKRQLYVAMTRAKKNLSIHINDTYLDDISADNLERVEERTIYEPPDHLVMQLVMSDVWLDCFSGIQDFIDPLVSGDHLGTNSAGCTNSRGQLVVRFSQAFLQKMEMLTNSGYELKDAKVNYVLYWTKDDEEHQTMKIILPELSFVR